MTASRPAHSARADLPVPARPPRDTNRPSGLDSRSSATRCSALYLDAERLPVAADQAWPVRSDPAECGAPLEQHDQAGVAGQLAGLGRGRACRRRTARRGRRSDLDLGHAGVAGVGVADRLAAMRVQADRRRLDPHRQVLGHQGDLVALVGEVAGHREDAVVVAEPEARRQRRGVGVVELHAYRAAVLADWDGRVEAAAADAAISLQHPQGAPGRSCPSSAGGSACPRAR